LRYVVSLRCTTRLENAHGTEFRAWSGLRIGIHEAVERPGGVVFRCDLTASDANRWLEIPAWMFDRSACAKVRLAVWFLEHNLGLPVKGKRCFQAAAFSAAGT
jgi:hypothetical protein